MANEQEHIQLRFTKENPKPNAPKYEISTIKELYDILTEDNYERFLADFTMSIKMILPLKALHKSFAENAGVNSDLMPVSFTWIDD